MGHVREVCLFLRVPGQLPEIGASHTGAFSRALFLEAMAENANQSCSTSLLPQCGYKTSASSKSTSDRIFEISGSLQRDERILDPDEFGFNRNGTRILPGWVTGFSCDVGLEFCDALDPKAPGSGAL